MKDRKLLYPKDYYTSESTSSSDSDIIVIDGSKSNNVPHPNPPTGYSTQTSSGRVLPAPKQGECSRSVPLNIPKKRKMMFTDAELPFKKRRLESSQQSSEETDTDISSLSEFTPSSEENNDDRKNGNEPGASTVMPM